MKQVEGSEDFFLFVGWSHLLLVRLSQKASNNSGYIQKLHFLTGFFFKYQMSSRELVQLVLLVCIAQASLNVMKRYWRDFNCLMTV